MLKPEVLHRPLPTPERPIAASTPEGRRLALVNESSRYVVVRCLASGEGLSTTGYDAVVRERTVSGTNAEYFRPNAMRGETFIEPGDEIEVLEIDHHHGFIHAEITLIRGNRYQVSRIISLNEHHSNADRFVVAPLLSEDGIPPAPSGSPAPIADISVEAEAMMRVAEHEQTVSAPAA